MFLFEGDVFKIQRGGFSCFFPNADFYSVQIWEVLVPAVLFPAEAPWSRQINRYISLVQECYSKLKG